MRATGKVLRSYRVSGAARLGYHGRPDGAGTIWRQGGRLEKGDRVQKYGWLMFVAGAILTWGAYVVTIDHGRLTLAGAAHGGKPAIPMPIAAMRAFLFIGLAYFALGVVFPAIYLAVNKVNPADYPNDPGWLARGVTLSTLAGILGAAGALCIVFAVGAARQRFGAAGAAYVAPLVFCFAPIINCFVAMIWDKPEHPPKWPFYVGLILAAVGAALVLAFKPEEHAPPAKSSAAPAPVIAPQHTSS